MCFPPGNAHTCYTELAGSRVCTYCDKNEKLNSLIGQLQELELHYFNVLKLLYFFIWVNIKIFAIRIHVELMYKKKKEREKTLKRIISSPPLLPYMPILLLQLPKAIACFVPGRLG